MNYKYIGFIIIILLISVLIFFIRLSIEDTNIKDLKIKNYIPQRNDISLISNATFTDINKFINKNFDKNEKENLNDFQNGIYSFFGFDFQQNLKDMYAGELAISLNNNIDKRIDMLLVLRTKEGKNLKELLNISNTLNDEHNIFELKRPDKLNYIKYANITDDNYLILSSSKELLNTSLNSERDNIYSTEINNLTKKYLRKIKNKKLLLIANEKFINSLLGNDYLSGNHQFISFLNFDNKKLHLKFISSNSTINNNISRKNEFIFNDDSMNLISTKSFYDLKKQFKFFDTDKIIDDIIKKFNNKNQIFFAKKGKDWIIFTKISKNIDDLLHNIKVLDNYNVTSKQLNNENYFVYTKDKLDYKNDVLSYEINDPIFIKEIDKLLFVSNKFNYLLNNENIQNKAKEIINGIVNSDNNKLFLDDQIYINNLFQNKLFESYPDIQNINFLIGHSLGLAVKKFNSIIQQWIPLSDPIISIEADLQIM